MKDPNVQLRKRVVRMRQTLAEADGRRTAEPDRVREQEIKWEKERMALEAEMAELDLLVREGREEAAMPDDPNVALRAAVTAKRQAVAEQEAKILADNGFEAEAANVAFEKERVALEEEMKLLDGLLVARGETAGAAEAAAHAHVPDPNVDLRVRVQGLRQAVAAKEGAMLAAADDAKIASIKFENERHSLEAELAALGEALETMETRRTAVTVDASQLDALRAHVDGKREEVAEKEGEILGLTAQRSLLMKERLVMQAETESLSEFVRVLKVRLEQTTNENTAAAGAVEDLKVFFFCVCGRVGLAYAGAFVCLCALLWKKGWVAK